jgi:hypothetical protein
LPAAGAEEPNPKATKSTKAEINLCMTGMVARRGAAVK